MATKVHSAGDMHCVCNAQLLLLSSSKRCALQYKATTSNITIGSMQKPPQAPEHERHGTEFLRWTGTICRSNSEISCGPACSTPKAFSCKDTHGIGRANRCSLRRCSEQKQNVDCQHFQKEVSIASHACVSVDTPQRHMLVQVETERSTWIAWHPTAEAFFGHEQT